jgi:SAM-dependent methyltransferase
MYPHGDRMNCRHCHAELTLELVDLGAAPPSNAFRASPDEPETFYPLRVMVCTKCWLVQTDITQFTLGYDEIFTEAYPYFSSTSRSFVDQAKAFACDVTRRFDIDADSLTVEIGSNDGYLLQWFNTPRYGVEPTKTAEVADLKGIETVRKFFTANLARELRLARGQADLMIANNVLAHVPDIDDFLRGFEILLKPSGVAVFEFPSLLNLVRFGQWDTIYHEHYSYLSLTAAETILLAAGLTVFDVEYLPRHGGSLRVYADKATHQRSAAVYQALDEERRAGIKESSFYSGFQDRVDHAKNEFLRFLIHSRWLGCNVAGFGAAAKGNTLLNYAGVRGDLLRYVVDDTQAKQGKFLPGSRIPVLASFPSSPDYIVILPWNFKREIVDKLRDSFDGIARYVCAIPRLEII